MGVGHSFQTSQDCIGKNTTEIIPELESMQKRAISIASNGSRSLETSRPLYTLTKLLRNWKLFVCSQMTNDLDG